MLLYFQALGLRKDDSFSTTMLQNTIENLMLEAKPCDGKLIQFITVVKRKTKTYHAGLDDGGRI